MIPVDDELFDLPPHGDGVVVVWPGQAEHIVAELAARGIAATAREELTLDDLRVAATVVLSAGPETLHPQAPAVLAARRALVAERCAVRFGFQPGFEYLEAETPAEAVEMVLIATVHGRAALREMRAVGRLAAERHRASVLESRDRELGV